MSVIQKIRDKYAKLAGGVIALALVGFILSDAASGSLGDLFGRDNSVAKVNGEKIDVKEYSKRIQDYETLYAMNSQNANLDENTRMQLREQALRDLINEKIVYAQADKLGLVSSDQENLNIIYGSNPDPMIRQYPVFTNPETGQFEPARVKQYEQQLKQNGRDANEQQAIVKEREKWETYKSFVQRNHTMQKYYNLISASAYVPKVQMADMIKDQGNLVNIRYVKVPFTTINDAEVKVTDADLNAYLEKRKKMFSIDQPTRSIEFVTFDVVPSSEDTARSRNALQAVKAEFGTTSDVETFVNRNSDDSYNEKYFTKATFQSVFADSILNLPIGAVYGPYLDNNFYKLARVMDRRTMPDSVNAQHVLVGTEQQGRADSVAKLRADSVLAMIKAGANFDSIATVYSDDPGSKTKGGDLGYFPKNMMVKEFDSVCFNGKTGDVAMVQTQFGYHIIKIKDQKSFNPATRLAVITKALYAGEQTESNVYAKANEFAGKYATTKGFDDGIKAMNLNKKKGDNVKVNDFQIPGLGPAREIIRWMYAQDKGDVSGVINMQDKYVIAKLTNIQEAGLITLDENTKPMIEAAVKGEKKAAIIKQKYASAKSIDAVAQASGQTVANADSVNITSGFIPGVGYELKVVGYAFNPKFAPNTLSPGIQGQDGVYYITVTGKITRPVDPNAEMMMQAQRGMMEQQLKQNLMQMTIEAMKNKAKIKYNSDNLY